MYFKENPLSFSEETNNAGMKINLNQPGSIKKHFASFFQIFGKIGCLAAVSRSPLHLCITSITTSTFKASSCSSAVCRENSLRTSTFLACARQHPSGCAWWQRAFSGRRAPPGHHQGTDMATCVVRLSPTLLRKAADRRAEGRALERRAVKISNIFFSA